VAIKMTMLVQSAIAIALIHFIISFRCQNQLLSSVDAFTLGGITRTVVQHTNDHSAVARALSKKNTENDEDDVDWRAFRAQLVQSETTGNTPSAETDKSTHWVYDSGDFVESGSIVLSIPSSDPIANTIDALTNVCYRKSIVLVLDVKSDFIQGIILNRPTNIRVMEGMKFVKSKEKRDDDSCSESYSSQWKVWFGGEALGPYSDSPQVMCLHSVQTDLALDVSKVVLPGILVSVVLTLYLFK
jgi:hypothetical protein